MTRLLLVEVEELLLLVEVESLEEELELELELELLGSWPPPPLRASRAKRVAPRSREKMGAIGKWLVAGYTISAGFVRYQCR